MKKERNEEKPKEVVDDRIPVENLLKGFAQIEAAAASAIRFAREAHGKAKTSRNSAEAIGGIATEGPGTTEPTSSSPSLSQAVKLVGRDLFETVYTAALKTKRRGRMRKLRQRTSSAAAGTPNLNAQGNATANPNPTRNHQQRKPLRHNEDGPYCIQVNQEQQLALESNNKPDLDLETEEEYEVIANENLYECPYEGDPVQAEINKLNKHVETLEPHGRHWTAILQVESHPSPDDGWMSVSASAADDRLVPSVHCSGVSVDSLLSKFQIVQSKEEEVERIETMEQIDRDIPRTYPNITYFRDPSVSSSLRRVLLALAALHPQVNYVQGLNFLSAFALLHMGSEDDCLWFLDRLMVHKRFQLENVYCKGLPNLVKFNLLFVKIVQEVDGELYAHLSDIGMGMLYCFHNWLLTLFAYTMPFDRLVMVWDYFLENGWGAFFRVCTVLVLCRRQDLLRCDMEGASEVLKEATAKPPVDLIDQATKLSLSDGIRVAISDAASFVEHQVDENAKELYSMSSKLG